MSDYNKGCLGCNKEIHYLHSNDGEFHHYIGHCNDCNLTHVIKREIEGWLN